MDSSVKSLASKFFHRYEKCLFKKHDVLVQADSRPRGVFYLVSGMVRQYATSVKGEEFEVNIFKSPSFFPMDWVLNDRLPSHYFEAMEDGEVWIAPRGEFQTFLQKNPSVVLDLLRRIYRGLTGYTLRLESMMTGDARARLIVELLIDAKRFGKTTKRGKMVKLRLTQDELASESGLARETVSREIKILREKGLLRPEGRNILISSIEKLERELVL